MANQVWLQICLNGRAKVSIAIASGMIPKSCHKGIARRQRGWATGIDAEIPNLADNKRTETNPSCQRLCQAWILGQVTRARDQWLQRPRHSFRSQRRPLLGPCCLSSQPPIEHEGQGAKPECRPHACRPQESPMGPWPKRRGL
jgi:hypothetical protein